MAEIINAPLTKPEPNMRSAITPPASNSPVWRRCGSPAAAREHAAGFEEDLQRVEEAVHLVALFARSELRGEVDRKLLIENVVHADTEHKHHQRPEARHTQQRQRILQPQIFRFAERRPPWRSASARARLSSNRNTKAAAEASQKLMFGSILKIKPAKKVALAQPSDPHAGAAEFETADAADSLGIRFQRADAGEEGGADKYPADQCAERQAAGQQRGVNVDKERAGQQQHHAEKLQQVLAQPKFVLNKPVQWLCAQRHQRDSGEDQAGLGAFQADLLIQPQ